MESHIKDDISKKESNESSAQSASVSGEFEVMSSEFEVMSSEFEVVSGEDIKSLDGEGVRSYDEESFVVVEPGSEANLDEEASKKYAESVFEPKLVQDATENKDVGDEPAPKEDEPNAQGSYENKTDSFVQTATNVTQTGHGTLNSAVISDSEKLDNLTQTAENVVQTAKDDAPQIVNNISSSGDSVKDSAQMVNNMSVSGSSIRGFTQTAGGVKQTATGIVQKATGVIQAGNDSQMVNNVSFSGGSVKDFVQTAEGVTQTGNASQMVNNVSFSGSSIKGLVQTASGVTQIATGIVQKAENSGQTASNTTQGVNVISSSAKEDLNNINNRNAPQTAMKTDNTAPSSVDAKGKGGLGC